MRRLCLANSRPLFLLAVAAGLVVEPCMGRTASFYAVPGDVAAGASIMQETLLEVWINGRSTGDTALLILREGKLFAQNSDLNRWRFRLNGLDSIPYGDRSYIALDSIDGLSYRIDQKSMKLLIDAIPGAFMASRIGDYEAEIVKAASDEGAFFNYDLMWQNVESRSELNGLGEIGVFTSCGLLLGTFVYRKSPEESETVRLETTYRKDSPEDLTTLTLGDAISRSGSMWGSSMRFGGIRWGTNFETQPGLITTPLLSLGGEASLPSTVDLYINNTLQMRDNVQPGPFTIDHIPLVSGPGEATLIVTDILGREQVITGSFYASPQLLRAGVTDYSLEAGFIRENFGISSGDYGNFMTSGTYRTGITDRFTAEMHGEWSSADTQAAGFSGVWLWDGVGIVSAAAAASHRNGELGVLGVAGFEHLGNGYNIGGLLKGTTENFAQIGSYGLLPRMEGQLNAGYSLSGIGFFNANFTYRDYREYDDIAILGIGYHYSWRDIGSLGLNLQRTIFPDDQSSMSFYFTKPLENQRIASINYSVNSDSSYGTARFQKSLPPGSGEGYAISADFGDRERIEALYERQNTYGTYSVEASRTDDSDGFRATARGGIATMDGNWFLSRRIDQSFAVVDTGDFAGMEILKDNLPAGETNSDGKLLVPGLRAYQKNPIGISESDLPMIASLPSLEQEIIPGYRSGVLVSFPLERIRRALMKVVLEGGTPPPSGAVVRIEGREESFPVGKEGKVYVEGLFEHSRISVTWNGSSCGFTLDYPKTDDPMPILGTYACQETKIKQEAVPAAINPPVPPVPLKRGLLQVVTQEGAPLPAGTVVQIDGKNENFSVGKDGKLYMDGFSGHDRIRVSGEGASCGFTLDYPQTDDPMPILGTFTCIGENPKQKVALGGADFVSKDGVRRGLLQVVSLEGAPLPSGAAVQIEGREESFIVGKDGKLYMEGFSGHDRIRVSGEGITCEFMLDYPKTDDPMPILGTYACKGVKR